MDKTSASCTSASLLGRLGINPNDGAAWEEFVRRYGRKILQWCRYWKLQEADAQDVTQTVLLRVARQMRTFHYEPGRSFRAWLKTIAHAAWCDWLEGQKRPGRGSGDSQVLEQLATVEARDDLVVKLEEEYDRELLEAASLRVRLRVEPHTWEAFHLTAVEGLSGAEVAARLSMKVGAVYVAKSKVQKLLQETIRTLETEEPYERLPPQDVLDRLLSESLNDREREALEEHLAGCVACQERLERLTTDAADRRWSPSPPQPTCEPSEVFLERLAEVALEEIETLGAEAAEPTPLARPRSFLPEQGPETAPSAGRNRPITPPRVRGYEILNELGRGGMGVVYLARQNSLNRLVALKMILAGAHAAQEDRVRFRAEAEAVARLQHPNIVQIYAVGEHEGLPFLCLEYVPGGSLSRHLAGTPQPPRSTAEFIETLARAVHSAHERGIVHRDLKPANILLQNAECRLRIADFKSAICNLHSAIPKLTDFGLAKRLDSKTLAPATGVAGTPSYMAPEQVVAESGPPGPATDIYALGAVLYEMLTGRPPFQGETPYDTLIQVAHRDPVSPRQLQPRLPRDLETICLKCLQKEPRRRYATALDLAEDLHRFVAGRPIAARPAGVLERTAKWARRRPAVASLAALVLLVTTVGLALVLWQWDRAERQWERAEHRAVAEGLAKEDARVKENEERQARREVERLSAGTLIDQAQALCEQGEIGRGLLTYVRALEMAERVQDPDLERVARIGLATWPRQLVRERARFSHKNWAVAAALSSDGMMVVTGGSLEKVAQRWEADTGKPIGEPLRHEYPVWAVALSPDGKLVLTGSGAQESSKGEARLWDAASGKPLGPPLAHNGTVWAVAFNPRDGRTFLTQTQHQAQLWDTATRRPVGAPLRHSAAVLAAVFSPDGKLVLTTGAVPDRNQPNVLRGEAQLWNAATGQRRGGTLTHEAAIQAGAFSPDGKRIATASWDNTARLWETATGKAGPVLKHRGPVMAVGFGPDGETVATGSMILAVDADQQKLAEGGGEARLWQTQTGQPLCAPLPHGRPVGAVGISPDGRILVTGCKDSFIRFFRVPAGEPIGPPQRGEGVGSSITFTRDGKAVLTTCGMGGDAYSAIRLWELPSEPDPHRVIPYPSGPGMIHSLAFSPDDNGKVLLTGAEDHTGRLWDVATGRPLGAPLDSGEAVWRVFFGRHGKLLLATKPGASIWDQATGRLLHRCQVDHPEVAMHPDGESFLAPGPAVQLWDIATGKPRGPAVKVKGQVLDQLFRPDGRTLLVLREEGWFGVWDLEAERFLRTWPHSRVHFGGFPAALSPDGRLLLTGGDKEYAQLWDVATGRAKGPPLSHRAGVLGFSPDGRTAVTCGGYSGQVRLWDVATSRPLGPSLWHPTAVFSFAFRPDGRVLALGGGQLHLWPMPEPLAGTVAEIRRRIETRTGLQLDTEGAIRELDPDTLR